MPPDPHKYVEKDYYERAHGDLINELKAIAKEQRILNDRLYKDNGSRSIQTILNDHDKVIKVLLRVVTIAGTAALTSAVGLVILVIKRVIIFGR